LICISFMARDVEHFFMYLLAIYISSFKNCLFSSFVLLFIGILILCGVSFLSSLCIAVNNSLSDVYLAKIFSHSVSCLFSLVTVSFAAKLLCLMQYHYVSCIEKKRVSI
jgi:hypothetical protein